ncbi:MAG: hypothetical protein AAF587_16635 [Bacteroidota bacterium]
MNVKRCLLHVYLLAIAIGQCSLISYSQPLQKSDTEVVIVGTVHEYRILKLEAMQDNRPERVPLLPPTATSEFKVVIGDCFTGQQPFCTFTLDDKGGFYFEAPAGTYSIVESSRPDQFAALEADPGTNWKMRCLKKDWKQPLLSFQVDAGDPLELSVELIHYSPDIHPCKK